MRLTALLLFAMLLVTALAAEMVNLSERNRRGWFKKKTSKLLNPTKNLNPTKKLFKKPKKSFLDTVTSFTTKTEGIASSVAATQQVVDNVSSLVKALGLTKNTNTIPETIPETTPEE